MQLASNWNFRSFTFVDEDQDVPRECFLACNFFLPHQLSRQSTAHGQPKETTYRFVLSCIWRKRSAVDFVSVSAYTRQILFELGCHG